MTAIQSRSFQGLGLYRLAIFLSCFALVFGRIPLRRHRHDLLAASVPPSNPSGADKLLSSAQTALRDLQQRGDDALRDFQSKGKDLMDNVKGRLNAAKEMCEEKLLTSRFSHDQVEEQNENLLEKVLSVMGEDEGHGWEFVVKRRGITVHRKFMPPINGVISKFCCVRASGVLDASAEDVAELFEGNTRVSEYNKYFAEGRDLEHLSNATKVVWASSPSIFMFKPRDYCTYVHYRKNPDGSIIVLNRAANHPEAPPTDRYVRAEVLMGASIIQPLPENPNKCTFTTIAHINPGGMVPAFLVNKLCARGPVEFHNLVEKAAKRTRTMSAKERKAAQQSTESKYSADAASNQPIV